jgi:hypothetical protein
MKNPKNPLQKQLEQQKFLHAIDYVRNEAQGLKRLTTAELSRINLFLTGHTQTPDADPWRRDAVEISLPGGHVHQMNILSNPTMRARDLLGAALQTSGNGQGLEAASFLYSQLVLEHLFLEANRRTAVAAALWIMLISGYDCDAQWLLSVPIGNLRQFADLSNLQQKIASGAKKLS